MKKNNPLEHKKESLSKQILSLREKIIALQQQREKAGERLRRQRERLP